VIALIERHRSRVRPITARAPLIRELFPRHRRAIAISGRFVPAVPTYAGLMAGTSGMPWRLFAISNVVGAVAWASAFGFGSYVLGESAHAIDVWLEVGFSSMLGAIALVGISVHRAMARVEPRSTPLGLDLRALRLGDHTLEQLQ
jgi:membrane protein DedA with SNARE-associated domain